MHFYNNQIRYIAEDLGNSGADGSVELLSSGPVHGSLSWSRSSTTLAVTMDGHGFVNGDYVVVRNMSADYLYLSASNVTSNAFDLTGVPDSGDTSGTMGTIIPAFKVSSFNQGGVTLVAPGSGSASSGSAQLISAKITTPTKTNTTFNFTMPTSRTNGAGGNDSLYTQNVPIVQVWALNNGNQNTSAAITLNTTSNFNVFQVGSVASLIKSMIKVTF